MYKTTIPMKLPFFNEYLEACKTQRGRWNLGNQIKQDTEEAMQYYLMKLPKFEKTIRINFNWICPRSDKHDLDNIAFAKKFILDAMQKADRLSNDNRKHFCNFTDSFWYGKDYEVVLEIEELKSFEFKEWKDD